MKSIVTGGCGFIGSHLVDELVKLGHEVLVIDNQCSASRTEYFFNGRATYIRANLAYFNQFEEHFENTINVFHLASEISIPFCVEKPRETMQNNILSTLNVLDASRKYGIERFVFSSTSAVYGDVAFLPNSEDLEVKCLNTYSISKYSGEQLCQMYYNLYGLKTVILRYFNVYGDRQPTSGSYAPVIGIFLRQRANGEPLTLVGDGLQRRDFVNVKDVVNANVLSTTKQLQEYGEVFNVGTGKAITIKNIAALISDNLAFLPERSGEVVHSFANIQKIQEVLNWSPTVDVTEWIGGQL